MLVPTAESNRLLKVQIQIYFVRVAQISPGDRSLGFSFYGTAESHLGIHWCVKPQSRPGTMYRVLKHTCVGPSVIPTEQTIPFYFLFILPLGDLQEPLGWLLSPLRVWSLCSMRASSKTLRPP